MTITVKKVGSKVVRDVTCPKCDSEMQYSKEDVKYQSAGFKDEGESYHYIPCPVCNHKIEVESPHQM